MRVRVTSTPVRGKVKTSASSIMASAKPPTDAEGL